ncbi:MAG: GNAT family N-acetyltransferase [Alphaproteobacteria bacterium]|nr:GNAT family N-acetyltransferase [Alphaproteobacteria bacterium]
MADPAPLEIREALESDVPAIRDIFMSVYGADYPYRNFYDPGWLKRSVFTDDILMLVAADSDSGAVLGTASVVFDIGAHSDLLGEFGRLAVHTDARGRGVGRHLMAARVQYVQERLHVGVVENRCVHPYSQRISHRHGFVPVGFLPMKHAFRRRESVALFARHFGNGLRLRNNHPRIVPEASDLAHVALDACGVPFDAVVVDDGSAYPGGADLAVESLTAEGLPSLLRIERGRVRAREVFGPMRLQYGFFKLAARHASYLLARQRRPDGGLGPIAGAIGWIHDDIDRAVKVFELIVRDEHAVRLLFDELLRRCRADWGIAYVEVDVSAHAPRMQRTLVQLGFRPAAYIPAGVFAEVERLDVVRMVNLLVPLDLGEVKLTPQARVVADLVTRSFETWQVLPRIAEAVDRIGLFDDLDEEQVRRVAATCGVAEFDAGQPLFHAGDPPDRMLLPLEGEVEIQVQGRPIGIVGAGEAVGELSLLIGAPHSATAVARGPLVAATLSRAQLDTLTRQRPDIGQAVFRNLACGLAAKLRRADAKL